MRSHPRLIAAVTGLVAVAALTGCSVGFPGSTASSSHPRTTSTFGSTSAADAPGDAPSATPKPDSHQVPLTAVPTTCPDPDAITISVKLSLPSVDPNPLGDNKLECTYYNAADAPNALVMTFGPSEGASVAEFSQQVLAAHPDAIAVPDVGDAAYFFTNTDDAGHTVGAMNYLSGVVFGYVYGDNSFATQAHLTALIADQILVP